MLVTAINRERERNSFTKVKIQKLINYYNFELKTRENKRKRKKKVENKEKDLKLHFKIINNKMKIIIINLKEFIYVNS